MNLLVTASQLADEVQAGSIPPPEDPQAVLGQAATLEGTKACAAEVLGRMTRLCYRHQNVRYLSLIHISSAGFSVQRRNPCCQLHRLRSAAADGFESDSSSIPCDFPG